MTALDELLSQSASLHRHLCPRQVLGVRMGMLAGELLRLELPQSDKRLIAIVETDGCFADGIAVATNCWLGRRTLRVEDYGKVAATFVDSQTEKAIRIVPQSGVRQRASEDVPEARSRWEGMLLGYQRLPARELLSAMPVRLRTPIDALVSRAGVRARCDLCGEEILNQREIVRRGALLCRACDGQAYYAIPVEPALLGAELWFSDQS